MGGEEGLKREASRPGIEEGPSSRSPSWAPRRGRAHESLKIRPLPGRPYGCLDPWIPPGIFSHALQVTSSRSPPDPHSPPEPEPGSSGALRQLSAPDPAPPPGPQTWPREPGDPAREARVTAPVSPRPVPTRPRDLQSRLGTHTRGKLRTWAVRTRLNRRTCR